jgi:hypothetical protein
MAASMLIRKERVMAIEVTFSGVSERAFRTLMERIMGIHEGVISDSAEGVIECRGVRGTLKHDQESRSLRAVIHYVPAIVTHGYVIGWLHDAVCAADHK